MIKLLIVNKKEYDSFLLSTTCEIALKIYVHA